jgi:hypothetical protein
MFEDWDVQIFDVVPRKNSTANPYTGQPIDPEGLTQSLVTMRLTHVATGKSLDRADVFSDASVPQLLHYAKSIIAVAEGNMAIQKVSAPDGTVITPSPLVGALVPPVPEPPPEPTQEQKDQQAFLQADAAYKQAAQLLADGKPIDPAVVDKLKAIANEKAQPIVDVIMATVAALPDPVVIIKP